jgi:hypothetical protein
MTARVVATFAFGFVFATCADEPTAPPPGGSISGEVTIGDRGLDGVTVSLSVVHSTSMSVTVGTGGSLATAAFRGQASNSDRDALVALFNATDGPNWKDNTNWLTDAPLGDWY